MNEDELRGDEVINQLLPIQHAAVPRAEPESTEPVIEVADLCKSFQGRQVLHNVNIKIQPGERYALIGESGSGKSTLARMILGIERMNETRGDLRVLGRSRTVWDGYDSRIQMVFQNFAEAVNPYMTSGNHLEALLKVNPNADRKIADSWLRDLGIAHCLPRTTSQMSGGEKRRLGLVETFAARPHLILADEPTAGLDKARQSFFLKKLDAYREALPDTAVTEFLISHDLNLVGSYADRIGVLFAGRLVQESTAEDLLDPNTPVLHPYSELLLRARTLHLDDVVAEEPGPKGCCYYALCHRKKEVGCEYRDQPPPRLESEDGWSLCPYPV